MTFEEKYAAQGRKLDELKAKLDSAIDAGRIAREKNREEIIAEMEALDARIDEFNASVDAKLEAKADEIDNRIDTTVDKIDARINDQAEKISAQMDNAEDKLEANIAKAKSAFTLDQATAESIANKPNRVIDEIQKQTAGDAAAAAENVRLIRERRDAKFSNARLRTEMKVNAAKEKVAERKEAFDKAAQEEWILDLLNYADGCYEMACEWAIEAEAALMEAAYEINDYTEKYGEKE